MIRIGCEAEATATLAVGGDEALEQPKLYSGVGTAGEIGQKEGRLHVKDPSTGLGTLVEWLNLVTVDGA